MNIETQTAALPPIRAQLVDHLMHHAEHASDTAALDAPARGALPDIVNLTAKLTLWMLVLCMYVPLIPRCAWISHAYARPVYVVCTLCDI